MLCFGAVSPSQVLAADGGSSRYTAEQVADAVRQSGLNPNLQRYADDIGKLAMFESGGRTDIYNGSCCTGILQVNTSNLREYGFTPESYAQLSLQEQVNVWAQVTNGGASATSVQRLMSMTTFDGQPVDGALVVSCIQLGVGNCQKMLDSGSCSGFADKNGTTICKMADKMRDGTSAEPNTGGSGQPNGSSGEETKKSLSQTILESADKCWVCEIVVKAGEVSVRVPLAVIEKLGPEIKAPMAVIFGVVLVVMVGKGLLWPSRMRWPQIFATITRFTIVYATVSFAYFGSEVAMSYVYFPAVQIGTTLGNKAGQTIDTVRMSGPQPERWKCKYSQPTEMMNDEAYQAVIAMADLSCRVHLAAYGPVVAGATLLSTALPTDTLPQIATAVVVLVIGFVMVLSSLFALAAFGMTIVDALLSLCITVAFSQILLFLWVFEATQDKIKNALKAAFYALFVFTIAGFMAALSGFIISELVSWGMDKNGGGQLDLKEVYDWVNTNMASIDMSKLTIFACFALAGTLISSHLIKSAASIARDLTGASIGQVTGNVVSGVQGAGVKMFAMPAALIGMGASYAGTRAVTGGAGIISKGIGRMVSAVER